MYSNVLKAFLFGKKWFYVTLLSLKENDTELFGLLADIDHPGTAFLYLEHYCECSLRLGCKLYILGYTALSIRVKSA